MQLRLDLSPAPLPLLASEAHLQRALSNLVHNAVEAMDQRGRLSITTRRCEVDVADAGREGVREGRYAVLDVSDTGKGIDPGDFQRIFEPFFSSKRLSDRSGSGLGLAIVDGVVKDHGGFIQVRSNLGEGTTFKLHFPLESDPVRHPERLEARLAGPLDAACLTCTPEPRMIVPAWLEETRRLERWNTWRRAPSPASTPFAGCEVPTLR